MTGLRAFAAVVIVMVAATVGAGLYLSGSPGAERGRQFDAQRLNALQQIASAVDNYYGRNESLPPDLKTLVAPQGQEGYLVGSLNDPQTQAMYEYQAVDKSHYEICAVFDLPSEKTDPNQAGRTQPVAVGPVGAKGMVGSVVRSWEHAAGRACFQLNATDRIGSVTCSLTSPCQAGQTCAQLPANKGTFCVPQGLECEAAGCPGKCRLLESYPVQVVCEAADKETSCELRQNPKSGAVGCFGCSSGTCTKVPTGWTAYQGPGEGRVGIPYSCFAGPKGCELAQ